MSKRVLSVGQCGVDHPAISRVLATRFGAETEAVDDGDEAFERLAGGTFDLVLVNRVLDRNGGDGLEVIRRLVDEYDVPVMLVSNFADWQARAVALGARPGFGKSELSSDPALDRLRSVLDASHVESSDD